MILFMITFYVTVNDRICRNVGYILGHSITISLCENNQLNFVCFKLQDW